MLNDGLLSQLIANEVNMLILIIDQDNAVVFANTYAKNLLGAWDAAACSQRLSWAFGLDVYAYITQQSFNYQWQGQLVVKTAAGERAILQGQAKVIPGDNCVFNHVLFIAGLHSSQQSSMPEVYLGKACRSWKRDQDQFRNLCEISATINSNLDYQSICAEITMKAAKLIGADKSLLYSVNNREIGVLASWNMTDFQRKLFRLVDMEHGIIKNCLRHMAPVLVPYYSRHPDWIPEIYEHLDFESFILYPLLAQKQLVGVLALLAKEPMQFSDQDLMLLQMISNQMAIAALNAQVYSEIRSINKHLEEEVCLKVNELKVSEWQLIRKHAELETVFHAISDILVVVDDHLRILAINKAAENYYGKQDKHQIIGKHYCNMLCERQNCKLAPKDAADCDRACISCSYTCASCYLKDSLASGVPIMTEVDAGSRVFMISVYPILDEYSKVEKIVCCTRDITLTKRKREELIQVQKMQAVGHLAAGVAHEIRNPLGAISNYVYILEDWLHGIEATGAEPDKEVQSSLAAIKRLVERSEKVIKNLLDFSRSKASDIQVFRLSEVLEQIMLLVGKTAQRNRVKIVIKGDEAFLIRSDSNAVQHILFNLIINAIDALPDGGEILVEYEHSLGETVLKVTDNGVGIDKDNIDKVFNPFYTTKSPDRGTGLGLYVVYNLVEQLHGRIHVASQPGIQTTFSVHIPSEGAIV